MKTIYVTRDRQTGTVIDEFATREAAEAAIREYEAQDKADGNYEPDFYEVAENPSACITKIEQRDGAQLIDWECGGEDDHVTTDFAWPGNVLEYNDDGKINHGWVLLEGVTLAVGDTVTLA